jgi:SAM-dependent MidA family methyltransferase
MGQPEKLSLVELGPGRGTLMQDVLRATKNVIGLHRALSVTLVEMSPVLRETQRQTLASSGVAIEWLEDISALPELPTFLLANEFFDALPVRHYQRMHQHWHQRLVGLDKNNRLAFGLAAEPEHALKLDAPEGSVLELGLIGERIMADLSGHIARFGGAGLIIDYGHTQSAFGETLQAMKQHAFVDPLEAPGDADITTHVDFERLGHIARAQGLEVSGPTTQAQFLSRLGIVERAARLLKNADAAQTKEVETALVRLTEQTPTGMGSLFKVLGLCQVDMPEPAGFK